MGPRTSVDALDNRKEGRKERKKEKERKNCIHEIIVKSRVIIALINLGNDWY